MGYIKAKNSEEYIKASIRQIKENVVKVTVEKTLPDMSNGFCFFLNYGDKHPAGKYEEYTTIFREYGPAEKAYSNDGSVYVPPEPEPEPPEPEPPTLEEVRAQKINEIRAAGYTAMTANVIYEGAQYPYAVGLRDVAENALTTGKQVTVRDAEEESHDLEPTAVKALYVSQEQNRVQAQEYTAQLVAHVQELSNKEEINQITYGVELPEDRKTQCEETVSAQMGVITAAVDMIEAQAEQARISAESNTDEQALNVVALYANWEGMPEGTTLAVGARLNYQGVLYKVLTEHQKQAAWNPADAPSLFAKALIPDPGEIPEWEQPGPENAYSKGDRVTHNGKTWESLVDNNVWEPGVVGTEAQWKEVTE